MKDDVGNSSYTMGNRDFLANNEVGICMYVAK